MNEHDNPTQPTGVFTLTGPAYRLMWLLTRDRFARRNRKAMGYV